MTGNAVFIGGCAFYRIPLYVDGRAVINRRGDGDGRTCGAGDGFHIILRLPLELETFRAEMVSQKFDSQIMKWLEEYKIETTEAYERIDPSDTRMQFELLQSALQEELQEAVASFYEKESVKNKE